MAALPPEQGGLLVRILADGEDLAATTLEEQTCLFGDWEFPPSDKVFGLTSGIMIGPQPEDKKHPHAKPPESLLGRGMLC